MARDLFPSSMISRRRGLTVLELLIIIIVVVVAVVLLLRWRGGNDGPNAPTAADAVVDSIGAMTPSAVASTLATRLNVLAPVDSVATAGDTVTVRLRATTENGTAVAGATVDWSVAAGGGELSAASSVTGTNGETELRWVLGEVAGTQVIRATIGGDSSSTVSLELSTTARTRNSQ